MMRILCVTDKWRQKLYEKGAEAKCWRRTGRVRWTYVDHDHAPARAKAAAFDRRVVDATTNLRGGANDVLARWGDLPVTVVDDSRFSHLPGPPSVTLQDVEREMDSQSWPSQAPKLIWVNLREPGVEMLRTGLESHLPLVLEKYFPTCAKAMIQRVSGGLSGVKLVRATINGSAYYIKFFDKEEEFKGEWEYHPAASKWLGKAAVQIRAVPYLPRTGDAQIGAFPKRENVELYPVCYESGRASLTLKEHYRHGSSIPFLKASYKRVLRVFNQDQTPQSLTMAPLMVEMCGPSRQDGTLVEAMRSASFREQTRNAIDSVGSRVHYALGSPVDWRPLQEFLGGTDPDWITTPVPLLHGKIHGDANARNFLISSQVASPQIIDCGAFRDSAPRLFDLAQMEADLIINLTAIERDAPGYGDIDTRLLRIWLRQQTQALHAIDGYYRVRHSPEVLGRAYDVTACIRDEAIRLSATSDRVHRGYYFFLLYWMLRKLHLQDKGLPHVKVAIALYSAAEICRRFGQAH
jgi:hypothetical protein